MELFDAAETSLAVEKTILKRLIHHPQDIDEARKFKLSGENIYKITITVEQVEPPL